MDKVLFINRSAWVMSKNARRDIFCLIFLLRSFWRQCCLKRSWDDRDDTVREPLSKRLRNVVRVDMCS